MLRGSHLQQAFKQKKKGVDSQFYFKLWIFEFWIFTQSFEIKIFFENHKHEQIILGGYCFSLKNTFFKPFQEKNRNTGVLQQFKT